ncbi:zinc/manganese transport system substrate-binding protein [Natronospira proteinivora]|uniref:Zinc/manganese transport system substrate-binding protein n=1 Tax=Natronospira proteinivora TaxID=1807133 RepID=A0ABT1GBF3_9GAMM|nr:metal ABC transporter substrate-binding protein [Natronospira proteinivora]MCP1727683.1 zinc/manganese transport system substrate-binding protein [Natronospira proteinivora]
MKKWILGTILMLAAVAASAEVRVAATVPNMGLLARAIGGDAVEVTVMAPPDRDAHYLEARPSMMAALRRADLLVAVGAELEVGWLPAALQGANNPRVQVGRTGYFEGAAHVDLIEAGAAADRAGGDVHPVGNPHFYMDPERMAEVAYALAQRLGQLDEDNADRFMENAERFEEAVMARMDGWEDRVSDAPGAVLYHKDINYLMRRLDVSILGYLEPLPGIPPTASHLRELVRELQGREGITLYTDFQPSRGADFLERELGWSSRQLPSQVAADADDIQAYIDMIDAWVEALASV